MLQADTGEEDAGPPLTFGQDPRSCGSRPRPTCSSRPGGTRPVLFVLDDLQWAGRPTLQLVLHWMRSPAALRCCFVATHRETRADISDTFDDALAEIHRFEGVTRFQVSGFDAAGVAAFVEATAGVPIQAVPERVVAVLGQQTDGNPFLLGELWRHFVETGALVREGPTWIARPATLETFDSPESVRSVVGRRIDRLPRDARELLEIAAVAGTTFTVELLATVTDTDRGAVLELLEPAIASATIEEIGPARIRVRARDRVARDLRPAADRPPRHAPSRGRARHRAARRHGADALRSRASLRRRGADRGCGDRGRGRRPCAPRCAMRSLAFEDAAELLLRRAAARLGSRARGPSSIVRIAEAELPAGDTSSALGHLREAAVLARADERTRSSSGPRSGSRRRAGGSACPATEAEGILREALPLRHRRSDAHPLLAARGRALALVGRREAPTP